MEEECSRELEYLAVAFVQESQGVASFYLELAIPKTRPPANLGDFKV